MLVGVLLGVGAAYAYLERAPVSYQSSVLLIVSSQQADQRGESWLISNPARLRDATELFVDQAASPPVYESVSRVLRDQLEISPDEIANMVLAGAIDVHQNGRSNYITVSVTHTNPDRSWLLTDGYARGLIENVNEQVRTATERRRVELGRQNELTQQQIRALPLKSPDAGVNQTVASVYATLLQNLIQDQVQVEMAASSGGPVARYGSVSDPTPIVNLRRIYLAGAAAGGATGLVIAIALELIRQRRRQRPRAATVRPAARPTPGRRRLPGALPPPRNGHRPAAHPGAVRTYRRIASAARSPYMEGM
jgi:uncharacterized protein involved in exopolysaccharide biosynthesis